MSDWHGPHGPRKELVARNVPAHEIDAMISAFEKLGARNIKKMKNPDGTFNVEAEFEN